jgi:hypothetical protein
VLDLGGSQTQTKIGGRIALVAWSAIHFEFGATLHLSLRPCLREDAQASIMRRFIEIHVKESGS